MRPRVTLKAAISLDGFLDDTSPNRRILSSELDFEAVDRLRAECDAILVGAETVRLDNPSLLLKDKKLIERRVRSGKPAHPQSIVLSASGNLDEQSKVFSNSLLLCLPESVQIGATPCNVSPLFFKGNRINLSDLLVQLHARGIEHLLVEGGNAVLSQFFAQRLFDHFRLSVAPILLGRSGAAKLQLLGPTSLSTSERLILENVEDLDACVVHHYAFAAISIEQKNGVVLGS